MNNHMAGMQQGDHNEQEQEMIRNLKVLKGHVIKTYKSGMFCDVTIKCKDGEVKAQKVVLYAQNNYFQRKLDSKPDLTEIDLTRFSKEVIQTIVDHLYFKPILSTIFTKDNAQEYLRAGDTFYIDAVRDEASVFMAKNMDVKFVLDMIQKPIFEGKMADDAMHFIAENFQEFVSDKDLKKKMLTELRPGLFADLLSMKNLMLWDQKTGKYLTALEREKQLFFLVLAYVSQEKQDRIQDLKMILSALRMSLLVSKRVINVHMIGAGLKKPVEVISGLIGEILDPFEKLDENYNLAALSKADKKGDKEEEEKFIAEACRMRYGSIPHKTHCSDLNLKLEAYSKAAGSSRSQFCPGAFQQETVLCKQGLESITVHICKIGDLSDKKDDEDKDKDKEDKESEEEKEEESEKEGNNEKDAEKDTEKDKEKDNDEDNDGEWVLCGMTLSDGSEDLSLGRTTGKVKSKKLTLNPKEFITEVYGHFEKEKVAALDARGKKKELAAQELLSMITVEDMSFKTNQDRELGPVREKANIKVGTIYKMPRQITRLEKDAPQNYWWLQGFGMEILGMETDPPESRPCRFYPIWAFQSSYKYYPNKYEGFEFVAGVKKHHQFSIKGIEEECCLKTAQDLEFVERTPVHEVVDLGDSDDEYSNDDNDDQDAEGEEDEDEDDGKADHVVIDNSGNYEDSVMIVDSDSEDGQNHNSSSKKRNGKKSASSKSKSAVAGDSDQEGDQDDSAPHGIFGGMSGLPDSITGGKASHEPIEIASSSDEDESGNGKRKASAAVENGSSGKKKKC